MINKTVRQILVGVAVVILASITTGGYALLQDIEANTAHRVESKPVLSSMNETLIRMEANQQILLKKYEADVN